MNNHICKLILYKGVTTNCSLSRLKHAGPAAVVNSLPALPQFVSALRSRDGSAGAVVTIVVTKPEYHLSNHPVIGQSSSLLTVSFNCSIYLRDLFRFQQYQLVLTCLFIEMVQIICLTLFLMVHTLNVLDRYKLCLTLIERKIIRKSWDCKDVVIDTLNI